MSTKTVVPVEEYLSTSYEPDCDYVDGELVERNVGEWNHSRLQGVLLAMLFALEDRLGIRVVPEQRVQVLPHRFRVPDLCVVVGPKPGEQILTAPPFLCIEILSREDRMTLMYEKIADYLGLGVPYVWVLDPRTKQARIYTSAGGHVVTEFLETENPAIRISVAELFARAEL